MHLQPMVSMRCPIRSAGAVALGLLMLSTRPSAGSAQGARLGVVAVAPVTGIEGRCGSRTAAGHPSWRRILEVRSLSDEAARPLLAHLVDSLASEAEARPESVEAQYLLAVALGARADVEGGRTKIRVARALHDQLGVVFTLDPTHAGAQHLLGRLHAAVRRMDSVTRWLATRLLGGAELAGASWTDARALLESAVVGDPCIPDHHYELARLYVDLGEQTAARDRLESMLELPDDDPLYDHVFERARALRRSLGEHGGSR